jgi:hypothetical protein
MILTADEAVAAGAAGDEGAQAVRRKMSKKKEGKRKES